jgi:hypothetical protein
MVQDANKSIRKQYYNTMEMNVLRSLTPTKDSPGSDPKAHVIKSAKKSGICNILIEKCGLE